MTCHPDDVRILRSHSQWPFKGTNQLLTPSEMAREPRRLAACWPESIHHVFPFQDPASEMHSPDLISTPTCSVMSTS